MIGRRSESRPALRALPALTGCVLLAVCGGDAPDDNAGGEMDGMGATVERPAVVELWTDDTPAFGIFVPSERERGATGPDGERLPPLYTADGAERLAANPLLDYLFLNLEGSYDPAAVEAIVTGLDRAEGSHVPSLLVRIPPISADGAEAARTRVAEVLAAGADGVVLPHVRSPEEARMAVGFFEAVGADVWSPTNPDGSVVAMLMIEDPGALAAVREIADVQGYSMLACGIGSLTRALGDRAAAEVGNLQVLEHATRTGRPDMITANADDVAQRIEEGFLGLLMNGPEADAHIRVGREAAGR